MVFEDKDIGGSEIVEVGIGRFPVVISQIQKPFGIVVGSEVQRAVVEMGGEFVLQYQTRLFKSLISITSMDRQTDQCPSIREQLAGIENLKVDAFVGS